MRSLRLHSLGPPTEVLGLEEVATPAPGPGEVLVDVHAAALNFPDMLLCEGKYQERPALPFTPGVEVAGTVARVGMGVTRVKAGDRVLGQPLFGPGGLAEQTLAFDRDVSVIPPSMGFDAAAALRITYHTGHVALHRRARLQRGETLLVHAGAGGVGSAAIQLGKAHGCRVIATAGGPEKVAVCQQLGADLAVDYKADDFVESVKDFTDGRGADVIYDPVGGDIFDRSRKCIGWEGRILIIGFTGGRIADAPTNHALVKNYSVVGVHWGAYSKHEPQINDVIHDDLMAMHLAGLIDPFISEIVPLADAPAAIERIASRGTVGKVVVHVRA